MANERVFVVKSPIGLLWSLPIRDAQNVKLRKSCDCISTVFISNAF